MRLPDTQASAARHVSYARYTKRRCTLAGFTDLAAAIELVNAAVIEADRAIEDCEGPAQDAVADRDAIDEALDDKARAVRQKLAGRSADATRTHPYVSIFHKKIEYYTDAPVDLEETRYRELCDRLEANLDPADPARTAAAEIRTMLEEWETAKDAVEAARRATSLARTRRDQAVRAWQQQLTKTYAQVIERLGKPKAERFFQKVRVRKTKPESAPDPIAPL